MRSKSRSLGRGYAVASRKLEHEKGVRALALASSLALLLRFAWFLGLSSELSSSKDLL